MVLNCTALLPFSVPFQDYKVDYKRKSIQLTDSGVSLAEAMLARQLSASDQGSATSSQAVGQAVDIFDSTNSFGQCVPDLAAATIQCFAFQCFK